MFNLAQKFEHVCAQFSDRLALKFYGTGECTYAELNELANRISHDLVRGGIQPGDVICIEGEKRQVTFAFMIASIKLGCPYCILDPESPLTRVRAILDIARPKVVTGSLSFLKIIGDSCATTGARLICFDDQYTGLLRVEDAHIAPDNSRLHGNLPAYIMYTSGSTGRPKGATISNASVMNFIEWGRNTFQLSATDRLTNVNPLFFDNSVFDFYCALFTGATLCPFTQEVVREPAELVRQIDELQCTSWFSTPSMLIYLTTLKVLDEDNFLSLKQFIFGGEGYPKPKLKKLFDLYSSRSRFYNVYGPTECTCICSAYEVTRKDFIARDETESAAALAPLGVIAENFSHYILNENLGQVDADEAGELWLGGPQVALGYYNDEDRTRAAFLQNPLQDSFRDILYRTGDRVYVNQSNGLLYFAGREDNQVKHMGYRIELEEIEGALYQIDDVEEVIVVHGQRRGLSRLIAAVRMSAVSDEKGMLRLLSVMLPGYMLPNEIRFMTELPKNANGKLDRRALAKQCFPEL